MSEDSELRRLRALAKSAEDQYWRLKMNIGDPAVLAAAREIWTDAEAAVERYKNQRRQEMENVNGTGSMSKTAREDV